MFDRYSGFVRCFCRERSIRATRRPVARAFLAPGLRKAESDSQTLRSLSPAAFPVLSPGARYVSGRYPGNSSLFFSLVFRRVAGIAARRGFPFARIENRALRIGRSLRSDAESARNTGSCPAGRAAGLHPSRRLVDRRRRHPIPLGRIRQSYISLCGEHTRPGVAISPNRGLRPADRVSDRLPVTRSPPTEGSSCAKAKASETRNPVRQGI